MPSSPPSQTCPHSDCPGRASAGPTNITRHGFYETRSDRRRRYECRSCGRTFGRTTATTYARLHGSRRAFDHVATLSVEGLGLSAIGRVMRRSRKTIARWLERAQRAAEVFNDVQVRGL